MTSRPDDYRRAGTAILRIWMRVGLAAQQVDPVPVLAFQRLPGTARRQSRTPGAYGVSATDNTKKHFRTFNPYKQIS
jgi:hypothetical protein